jgi:tetratricopeptide (TPR) repeat protein
MRRILIRKRHTLLRLSFALSLVLLLPQSEASTNKSGLLDAAKRAETARAWKKALGLYRRISAIDSYRETGTLGIVRTLTALNEIEEATSVINEFLKDENPFSADGRVALAELLLRNKDANAALTELSRAESIRPKYAPVWIKKAQAYLQLQDASQAEFAASMALAQNNKSWEALLVRARALRALEKWTRAEKDARRVLDERPQELEAAEILADALVKQSKTVEAFAVLQQALKVDSERPGLRLRLARTQVALKRTKDATQSYRDLVLLNPNDVELGVEFARFLADTQQAEASVEELKRLAGMEPANEEIARQLITQFRILERLDLAAMQLKVFTTSSPGVAWAHLAYARLLLGIGRTDEAGRQLDQVTAEDRNQSPDWHVLTAVRFEKEEKAKKAMKVLEEATSKFPSHPAIWFNLAVIKDRLQDKEGAIEAYRKVPEDSALRWKATVNAALAEESLGRTDVALTDLKSLAANRDQWNQISPNEQILIRRKVNALIKRIRYPANSGEEAP